MAPSKDKDSVIPKKVDGQIEDDIDETTQTDGGLIKVTIDVEQETERLAPSILCGVLNIHSTHSDERLSDTENEIVKDLQLIGDALNQRIIDVNNSLKKSKKYSVDPVAQFKRITWQMIGDGINWGRIAVIFSLGALVVKDLGESIGMSIFDFLMEFIKKKLFSWIVDSGGWKSVKEYLEEICKHPSSSRMMVAVAMVAGAVVIAGFIYNRYG